MQQQSFGTFSGRTAVEIVTENRMAEGGHMDAKLVRATGDGLQLDACRIGQRIAANDAKTRLRRLPNFEVDLLSGAIWPVADQRQVDFAIIDGHQPVDDSEVTLVDLAITKKSGKLPMHFRTTGQNQQAGGGHVETMGDQRIRKPGLNARRQAVVHPCPATRDGKQPGRLVDDDYFGVGMNDSQAIVRGRQINTQNGVTLMLQ